MLKRLRLWWNGICRHCEYARRETGYNGYCYRCYQYKMWNGGQK